ncbi:hypothetical protein [Thiolapillus sp.]
MSGMLFCSIADDANEGKGLEGLSLFLFFRVTADWIVNVIPAQAGIQKCQTPGSRPAPG